MVWTDVLLTSLRFDKQLDKMVEGKDYYIEEVRITKKYIDSYSATNDKVPAYTTDHVYYALTKEGILPRAEHRKNEIKKVLALNWE